MRNELFVCNWLPDIYVGNWQAGPMALKRFLPFRFAAVAAIHSPFFSQTIVSFE
jgi:hypothetical protein